MYYEYTGRIVGEYDDITGKETTIDLDGAKVIMPTYESGKLPTIEVNGTSVKLDESAIIKLTEWYKEHNCKDDLTSYIDDVRNGSEDAPEGVDADTLEEGFDDIMEYYAPKQMNGGGYWRDDLEEAIAQYVEDNGL